MEADVGQTEVLGLGEGGFDVDLVKGEIFGRRFQQVGMSTRRMVL